MTQRKTTKKLKTKKAKPKHRPTKRGKKVAWQLDDADWDRIGTIFPVKVVGPDGGRPRVDNRRVFEALIWFARAGCPWEQMPKNFPSWSTCRRRLIEWEEDGIFAAAHQHLLALLDEQGKLRLDETFLDGSFIPAKKGANVSVKPRPARVR
jgi:transposase